MLIFIQIINKYVMFQYMHFVLSFKVEYHCELDTRLSTNHRVTR